MPPSVNSWSAASIERRHYFKQHLFNLIRVGAVAYYDVGRAWDTRYDQLNEGTLSNIGFGLRLTSSKAKNKKIAHLDLAFPLSHKDREDSVQWLVRGRQKF